MSPETKKEPSDSNVTDDRTRTQLATRRDGTSILLLVSAAALFAMTVARDFSGNPRPTVGQKAPPLVAQTLDGKTIDIAHLAGTPVLIDFWSMACAPCVAQVPVLHAALRRFREQGVRLLSLVVEPTEWPRAAHWLIARIPEALTGTVDAMTVRAFGATRLPRIVLIGSDGIVARVFSGFTDEEKLVTAIQNSFRP